MFHVAKHGDQAVPYADGAFGTLYECVAWILRSEGMQDAVVNVDDPLSSLDELPAADLKYDLNEAPTAIMRMLTLDEGMHLPGAPHGVLTTEEFRDWLDNEQPDNATVFAAAEILHQRHTVVRWRGQQHRNGLSPFTNQQFADLTRELFTS